jgi:hypothetical protein
MIWILCFTNQFLTTVCSTFNPTCDAQMRTDILLLNAMWLKYDYLFIAKLIIFVAYVNMALFFSICLKCMCIKSQRRLIGLVWITKMLSKVKEFVMCVYVICMNKHVGITLSVFLLVLWFFPVSDLRKLALSTTLHPKCLSLVKNIQCVPIDQYKSYNVFISVFYQN